MYLDEYITGDFDDNNPVNKPDDKSEWSVYDLITYGDAECKYVEKGLEKLAEVRKEVNQLRQYCKETDNTFILKKLNSIYNKL